MTLNDLYQQLHEINISDSINVTPGNGLVVLYGASDDLLELTGEVKDEKGAYEGGIYHLIKKQTGWQCLNEEEYDAAVEMLSEYGIALKSIKVDMKWDHKGISWFLSTDYPYHLTFDILEDGDIFCRGLIIDLNKFEA